MEIDGREIVECNRESTMIYKSPKWLRKLFPSFVWSIPTEEKVLYLTFDDGPIPVVTEYVLEELEKYNAKATFFCVGDNVRKHPEIFEKVLAAGHAVGNHTFNHLHGWTTSRDMYVDNVAECAALVSSNLFRPPFGRIKKSQRKALASQYKIIKWSILTWDFLPNLDKDYALKTAVKKTKRGDIIVFHDSLKAEANLRYMLPHWLTYFSELGFTFKALEI